MVAPEEMLTSESQTLRARPYLEGVLADVAVTPTVRMLMTRLDPESSSERPRKSQRLDTEKRRRQGEDGG